MESDDGFNLSSSPLSGCSNTRKRGSASLTTSPPFCSQADGHNMEVSEANIDHYKKSRFNEPTSPGIVSLQTMDLSDETEIIEQQGATKVESTTKVEWWKQQRIQPRNSRTIDTTNLPQQCIVCRLPCHSTTPTNRASVATMDVVSPTSQHQTTLLQYFTPKFIGKSPTNDDGFVEKKMTKMVLSLPVDHLRSNSSYNNSSYNNDNNVALCAFCEKAICSNCQITCEDCQQVFCSFCSTRDYTMNVERVVCLDCRDRSKESSHHMLID
jgi:hypothetical protein